MGVGEESASETTVCPRCGGTGWIIIDDKAYRCDCYESLRLDLLLSEASIPARYSHCNLREFNDYNLSLARAKALAFEFVKSYPASREGLLFMGGCGVGKTHLAVGIIKELVSTKAVPCLFCDFRALLEEIRETYSERGEGPSESDILEPVLETPVVVLDDLGAEKTTDWVLDRLGYIISYRYNHEKTMIITTNFLDAEAQRGSVTRARETLEDRIGPRVRSRLFEMCKLVRIKAGDYRQRQQVPKPRSRGSARKG